MININREVTDLIAVHRFTEAGIRLRSLNPSTPAPTLRAKLCTLIDLLHPEGIPD